MRRKIATGLLALLTVLPACGQSRNFQIGQWMDIQNSILKELNQYYVDTLPVEKMKRAAIDAMLQQLDPYTVYVPEEETEDFNFQINKVYGGIGAVIYKREGEPVYINEPYTGSPCLKSGMECGDQILKIDGTDTTPLDAQACSNMMKGTPGSEVEFLVKKVHSSDTLLVKVKREKIHLPDIEYCGMLDAETGYILQSGFTEGVGAQVRDCVTALKRRGMKKLVYDLRGNGGGLMMEAVEIVSVFVPKGSLVVSSKGRGGKTVQSYHTSKDPVDVNLTLVVLVDGGSASASEIVSGALQDLDRATIMGTRTFGKGLVQSIRPVPYGGQLKVTVAKYYTPSGRCVQAIDYSNRKPDGSVGHIPDSLTHEFKTLKGRTVRDGGGITPDIEIPYTMPDEIVYSLVLGGIVNNYALHYKLNHPSIAPASEFEFTEFEDFVEYARPLLKEESQGKLDSLDWKQLKPFVEEEIIVRYYQQAAGVECQMRYDEQLKEALKQTPVV